MSRKSKDSPSGELATIAAPKRGVATLGERELAALEKRGAALTKLAESTAAITAITNPAGRDECHRAAMVAKGARIAVEKDAKEIRDQVNAYKDKVIAAERKLVALIAPEEDRLTAIRDAWDEKIAAEKAAKAQAEREAQERVQSFIREIQDMPLQAVGKTVPELQRLLCDVQAVDVSTLAGQDQADAAEAKHAAECRMNFLIEAGRQQEAAAAAERAERARIDAERLAAESRAAEAEARAAAALAEAEAFRAELAETKRTTEEAAKAAANLSDAAHSELTDDCGNGDGLPARDPPMSSVELTITPESEDLIEQVQRQVRELAGLGDGALPDGDVTVRINAAVVSGALVCIDQPQYSIAMDITIPRATADEILAAPFATAIGADLAAEMPEAQHAELRNAETQVVQAVATGAAGLDAGELVDESDLGSALELLRAERVRHVHGKGYSCERDDEYTKGQLAQAAASYALIACARASHKDAMYWWPREWAAPKFESGSLRSLVKAGSLIIAEIERLVRAGRIEK